MVKKATFTLLACLSAALIASSCKKEEEEMKNIPLQDNAQPSLVSEEQLKQDSILEGFNAQLKTLDEKIQVAKTSISKMGKKKNWNWRNKVEVIEAKRKKVVDDAVEFEKRPNDQYASELSRLNTSLDLLSRDLDRLLRKMK
ncbi:MAG: hypothetical protein ABIW76_02005 [Fibrobacteria bacterium]